MSVTFSDQANEVLESVTDDHIRQQIIGVLSYDVRPAYKKNENNGEYGMQFSGFNIRWQISGNRVLVISISDSFDSDPA
jgi:hypothetical protein